MEGGEEERRGMEGEEEGGNLRFVTKRFALKKSLKNSKFSKKIKRCLLIKVSIPATEFII